MATRYAGPGGNDGNSGLTWALRKLTLNGVEDTPVVAGDVCYIGPGVYRELLTVDVSGGNAYQVGTVNVTNGSKQITGNGTAWLANVAADYMFHISVYASGNDGVADGTATFTSAGGNFQAAMIGQIIQVNTRNSYKIGAVAAANSITLVDVNGVGWPGVGGGLTYSAMSGQGHYDVNSVDDNTTIQLKQAWNGPTLTTIAYLTYNPIRYVGDVTGEHTDGVGGVVRVTGSDNDTTATRNNCIYDGFNVRDYRTFRGFRFDLAAQRQVYIGGSDSWIFEDCVFSYTTGGLDHIIIQGTLTNHTIRRCLFCLSARYGGGVYFVHNVTHDDAGNLIENCIFWGSSLGYLVHTSRVGGITIRNCAMISSHTAVKIDAALSVGQTVAVNNCVLEGGINGVVATAVGEIVENYNSLYQVSTARTNTTVGAQSNTYPALMNFPILHAGVSQISGFKFPWWFGELSEWSQVRAITGSNEPAEDLQGIARPVTASKNSWGPVQFRDMERETGTKHAGAASLVLHDAGRHQIFVPVTNTSTTISVYVYREANYAGNNPQMIVKQPGQADDITTDAAAASQWNQLTTTLTPAADPPYVIVELVSRNTAAALAYEVFFDDLVVN